MKKICILLLVMQKIWGKTKFQLHEYPRSGSKVIDVERERRKKKKKKKIIENNDQIRFHGSLLDQNDERKQSWHLRENLQISKFQHQNWPDRETNSAITKPTPAKLKFPSRQTHHTTSINKFNNPPLTKTVVFLNLTFTVWNNICQTSAPASA